MMNDSHGGGQGAGLCGRCANVKIIENSRGSRFYLCRLSATDDRFPKYPRLPVLRCIGFAAADGAEGETTIVGE
jgi:hypothetical protein